MKNMAMTKMPKDSLKAFWQKLKNVYKDSKTNAKKLVKTVKDSTKAFWQRLKNLSQRFYEKFRSNAGKLLKVVKDFSRTYYEKLKNFSQRFYEKFKTNAKKFFKMVKTLAKTFWEKFKPRAEEFFKMVKNFAKLFWQKFKDFAKTFWKICRAVAKMLCRVVKDMAKTLKETLFSHAFFSSKKNVVVFATVVFFCLYEIVGIGIDWNAFKKYKDMQRTMLTVIEDEPTVAENGNTELKDGENASATELLKQLWEKRLSSLHWLPSIMLLCLAFFLFVCLLFRCWYFEELKSLHQRVQELSVD